MPTRLEFNADTQSASPLYLQLAQQLARSIRDGIYQAAEALPSERQLAESLGLSRVTTRKAIDQLVAQGLVVRKRGSGNYISPRLEHMLSRLSSFSEELRRRGFRPGSHWLSREITQATPGEQLSLGLGSDQRVARLARLRLADDRVVAYEMSVLPDTVLPQPAAVEGSLYDHLARLGFAPVRALQHVRAINADAELAARLAVPHGQAVLFIARTAYQANGQAIELTHSYCRSDYYDFIAEMRRTED